MGETGYDPKESFWRFEIEVELADLIDNDFEGFLDLISEKATDSPLLMDLDYGIAGLIDRDGSPSDVELQLWVAGDCSAIFDNLINDLPVGTDEQAQDAAIVAWLREHKAQPAK